MSSLLARVMLAVFMLPLAALVYTVTLVVLMERWLFTGRDEIAWYLAGGVTWAFIAIYWISLWKKSVRRTSRRRVLTLAAVLGCAVAGLGAAMLCQGIDRGFAAFVGTALAPLLWLACTTFIWRETAKERTARLAGVKNAIVCPNCGYNLTGLSTPRCPECGKQYTLDELLVGQPGRETVEL